MRTIETKTNIDVASEITKNPLDLTRDGFNKNLLSLVEQGEIVNKKGIEKTEKLELVPIQKDTHSLVESELAKMFGLDGIQISKLNEDFKEQPVTLAGVMAGAEDFWGIRTITCSIIYI